ncbi:MAG: ATP-binding protein [Muribaculaceae bacterium]|nr:ATP-binding protein [Muribaculaceae bacterium]
MVNKEILKSIIIEGQELLNELTVISREFHFEDHARYVFVGVRQAGKSYLLYLRALRLIAEGHDVREMLFINFDDERLLGLRAEEMDEILQAYAALFAYRPIIFLDEIQNIEGWEHFARRLANQKYMVYITGSNAKMLSKEIASKLGGRYIEKMVFPYSFKEYLSANGVDADHQMMYGKQKGVVERHLSSYFQWGGFPELTLFVNKRHWLNELYEKIILSDIIRRNGIKNEQAMRLTLRRLAENIKTPTSYNRLANIVKATGCSITPTSVSDYIQACKEGCLLFEMENFASKFVERSTVKKHYFVDNGLLNIFLSDSETSLLENLCAITLYRDSLREEGGEKVYFYNKECEIDFYLPDSGKAIQASYSLSSLSTKEREIGALLDFNKRYGLKEAEIVTYSEEETLEYPDLTIRVIPLAKWLLKFDW